MLADAKYISLTTFRRDGSPVATPVWVAPLDDQFVVITQASSHKVRRLRRNPQVEVRPCNLRGTITPDAPTFTGTGWIRIGADAAPGVAAIRAKYGLPARLWPLIGKLSSLLRRRPNSGGVVIELDLRED